MHEFPSFQKMRTHINCHTERHHSTYSVSTIILRYLKLFLIEFYNKIKFEIIEIVLRFWMFIFDPSGVETNNCQNNSGHERRQRAFFEKAN